MATIEEFMAEWHSASPYVIAHTSGSTGTPKEIRLPKEDMRCSARATNEFFGIDTDSFLVCPLSPDYIAGKMMGVRATEAGCRLAMTEVSNTFTLPSGTIDLLPVVPSQIPNLIANPHWSAHVRNVLIGGAAPSQEMCEALTAAGYTAFISYGMTETCSHVALARADDISRIFHAMPGISFETDAEGRLTVVAPAFSFKRLATCDVVELIDSHSFRWRGRDDGAINSGGIKMFPEELESLYAAALSDRKYYVTSEDHPKWGRTPVLVVEGNPCGLRAKLEASVNDRRRLPSRILSVEKIPAASNGKIRRLPPEKLPVSE